MLDKIFGPLARRFSWVATALKTQKRFSDVRGNYLAGAVALNIFVAIFPLLLVAIAIIGLITQNDGNVAGHIVNSLGLSKDQADTFKQALTKASETKKTASIVGLLGLLYSGLGVVSAIEYALDATWQLTGRGIKDRVRGLIWGVGALIILGASVALTASIAILANGAVLYIVSIPVAVAINVLFWLWTFFVLSFQKVGWRHYLPGAILAGFALELIKQLAALLPGVILKSSSLYGPLGTVFGIIATLVLFSRLIVYASVLNVVKWEGKEGTVAVEIETPRLPGVVPLEADRAGAVDPD